MKIISFADLTPELARAGCFVTDMPNEAYHAYAGISKSGLDLIDRSPAHYAYAPPHEPSRAMVIGSAIHAAILEPELFAEKYMLLRDVTDRRSSVYKQAIKAHPADLVITGKEADLVAGMQESALFNPAINELLALHGLSEVTAFVLCPDTGVLLRSRFDYLTETGVIVDLKKTQDIRYDQFARSVGRYRYHVQDALYSCVYSLLTGDVPRFVFACIEEQSPHASKLYELDDEAKMIGLRLARRNIATYAQCVADGHWPFPDGSLELMSLPGWCLEEEDYMEVTA